MIEKIVPSTVAAVEAFDDPVHAALYPQEEAVIARAADKRRREFTSAALRPDRHGRPGRASRRDPAR